MMDGIAKHITNLDIPTIMGEFGCVFNKGDREAKYAWVEYYASCLASYNLKGYIWDDGGSFRLSIAKN